MRQLDDVENDLRQLTKDLSSSLESRHDKCLSSLQHTLTCMDIDSLINLLVGKWKACGYPSLTHEDEFVENGKKEFKKFYTYVCSLNHVKELAENHFTELKLRPIYSDEVLTKLKNTLTIIVWTPQHVQILSRWLSILTIGGKGQVQESSLECEMRNLVKLMDFQRIQSSYFGNTYYLQNLYNATFLTNDQKLKTFVVLVNEGEVYRSLYVDEFLFNEVGVEMSIAIDIAWEYRIGNTESIVESLYSVMKSQSMEGGQDNSTLALRTKIDWLMPTVIQADKIVAGVAEIYIKGNSSHKLPKHRWPILSAKATSSQGKDFGKVISRKKNEAARLPFLL